MGVVSKIGEERAVGFTIIEVMLFLAISGLLAAFIMGSMGLSMRYQQYRDNMVAIKSYLQTQYNSTTNVFNPRSQASCNGAARITTGSDYKGTTECLVMGRYITTDSTGTSLKAGNIIGRKIGSDVGSGNDLDLIKNSYALSSINSDNASNDAYLQVESQDLRGAGFVMPDNSGRQPFTMAILRGPNTGDVMTFVVTGTANATFAQLISNGSNFNQSANGAVLCVASDKATYNNSSAHLFDPTRLAIQIKPYATTQAAVEIPTADTLSTGDGRRCKA